MDDLAAFVKENGKYKYDAKASNKTGEDGEEEVPLAEGMGEAAKAATETVKSKVSEATEAVKSAAGGDEEAQEDHDEL